MQCRAVIWACQVYRWYEQNCIFREYTVKNARNRHENDVYCGPSLCFVSNICTESAIFATTTDTFDTALTPKTKKLSKFRV